MKTFFRSLILTGLWLHTLACSTSSQDAHLSVSKLVKPQQDAWLKGTFTAADPSRVERIVIFGDSLSDTGRLHARTKFFYPPEVYWHSRASNGPIWIDYVANAAGWKVSHHAVAGATAGSESWLKSLVIPPVSDQVEDYLDDESNRDHRRDLAVIWIGPNNYFSEPEANEVNGVMQEIEAAVAVLHQAGFGMIALGTMPELGGLPVHQRPSAQAEDKALRVWTAAHNKALKRLMDTLKRNYRQANLFFFDAFRINQQTVDRPLDFGFRNILQACYKGDYLGRMEGKAEFCPDPSAYKFWDEVHPNSKMHCYYAVQFLADLQEAGLIRGYKKEDALHRCQKL